MKVVSLASSESTPEKVLAALTDEAVAELIKTALKELQRVLMLRQQLTKSSAKKYLTMANTFCADDRTRKMFQFYGANRTGESK